MSKSPVKSRSREAFSLLETVAATVIVSIMLAASMSSLANVLKLTSTDAQYQRATYIAQLLLAEITALPFADPVNATETIGLETDELSASRSQWDDCDDFHGWNPTSIQDRDGNDVQVASGWSASVAIAYCSPSNPSVASATATSLKKITLTVTSPAGQAFAFESLRGQGGVLEKPQPASTTVLSSVEISLDDSHVALDTVTRVQNQQEPN